VPQLESLPDLPPAAWASDEMTDVDLLDRRLNRRLVQVLSQLGQRPTASIPAACGGYAEMTAAYRFFDNDKVTWQRVLQPHYRRTLRRAAQQEVVLLVQDTTELDLTRPVQQVRGAGPLDGSARRGVFLHPLQAFTPDGLPLGAVAVDMWARPPAPAKPRPKGQRPRRVPLRDKESHRWLRGLQRAREAAQQLPQTTCVYVADSEADIYELFAEPQGPRPVQWLIRCGHSDRRAARGPAAGAAAAAGEAAAAAAAAGEAAAGEAAAGEAVAASPAAGQLRQQVLSGAVLFSKEITVRGRHAKVSCDKRKRRQPRQDRKARVEVRAATVTLQPPWRPDGKLPPVTVNAVLVTEVDPPQGDEPVEWLLLTTLPIGTAEQVGQVVQYYTVRFLIEVFFRVLKSGCRVEGRLFEELDRLLPCVAVYLIVAWRTLMVCRLGRGSPELSCEAVFEPSEWQSVWVVVKRTQPPATPPALEAMLKLVAQLGGYVNRPGRQDPPGPQTVWLGLQRMYDLARAWETFGPGAAQLPPADDV
jgi:hypothetical protein